MSINNFFEKLFCLIIVKQLDVERLDKFIITIIRLMKDGWMKWVFTSFIFAQDRLIRTARDHSNEVKCAHGTE